MHLVAAVIRMNGKHSVIYIVELFTGQLNIVNLFDNPTWIQQTSEIGFSRAEAEPINVHPSRANRGYYSRERVYHNGIITQERNVMATIRHSYLYPHSDETVDQQQTTSL